MNFKVSLLIFIPSPIIPFKNDESVENMDSFFNCSMKSHSLFLFENLTSILNQDYNNMELLIFSKEKKYILTTLMKIFKNDKQKLKNMVKIIEVSSNLTSKELLILGLKNCTGELLCPINFNDILHKERIKKQVELIKDSNLAIVSSLELPIELIKSNFNENKFVYKNYLEENLYTSKISLSCEDSNKFISKEEIDFACLNSYIPLDLYTFMIKRSFLEKLQYLLHKKALTNTLNLILFLLSYTEVEKSKDTFTYVRNSRIPYEENLNIENSINSTNVISLFNKFKTIENREFLRESLNLCNLTPKEKTNSSLGNVKVLIPIKELNIGGTETYILSLCKTLIDNNLTPYILTTGGILEDTFLLNNIKVIKSPSIFLKEKIALLQNDNKVFFKEPIYKFPNIKELKNIIKENRIDILFCHGPTEINLCYELKKFYDIPTLTTIHGTFYSNESIVKAASNFEALIFVSKMSFVNYNHLLKDFPQNKFYIIPNFISNKSFKKLTLKKNYSLPKEPKLLKLLNKIPSSYSDTYKNKETPRILTYCSRLSLGKGKLALLFLKSFELLLNDHKNIYAIILGDGPEKIKILDLANRINSIYGTKVFVLGSIKDVDYFFKKSFAVIGTGRVALEALSIGTPVFALGLSGFKGLVCEENIEDMIDSNFGDHPDLSLNSDFIETYINKLKNDLDYFLNSINHTLISNWSKIYIRKNLNTNILSKDIINIIFDTLKRHNS